MVTRQRGSTVTTAHDVTSLSATAAYLDDRLKKAGPDKAPAGRPTR